MAAIVGVHGIGKYRYYRDAGYSAVKAAEALRAKWNRYLRAGLAGSPHAEDDHIVEVAYYAHHLAARRPEVRAAHRAEARAATAMDAEAQRVFVEWASQLDGIKDAVGESLTGALRWAVERLMERLDGRAAAFATLFCPEVAAYLESPNGAARTAARRAVADTLRRNQPCVVIAHSLGSVVAYEALHAEPDLRVDLLVTLGSPLGMRNVVFERLLPAPLDGRGRRPPGVARWVNIADAHDIAAIPPSLAADFIGVDQESLVDLDWIDFHTAEKYLGTKELASCLSPYLAKPAPVR
ncbi:hypothetical protein [Thermostaphylospora chromogena]|uniref:Serine peptidase n=1 Tax=Thermostaphylospora chromogena TaxID=35622 RepID=A0A1H1GLD8_9ACTN|nr:hypothetical protein [Thermostaphylospora chromogena]SDR13718.1 hypothetical protein SAMN04489764_3654 [Thermostaphylospora chromogena]